MSCPKRPQTHWTRVSCCQIPDGLPGVLQSMNLTKWHLRATCSAWPPACFKVAPGEELASSHFSSPSVKTATLLTEMNMMGGGWHLSALSSPKERMTNAVHGSMLHSRQRPCQNTCCCLTSESLDRSALGPDSTRQGRDLFHPSVTEQMHSPQPGNWSLPRPNQLVYMSELRLVGTGHFVEPLASVPSWGLTALSAFP